MKFRKIGIQIDGVELYVEDGSENGIREYLQKKLMSRKQATKEEDNTVNNLKDIFGMK